MLATRILCAAPDGRQRKRFTRAHNIPYEPDTRFTRVDIGRNTRLLIQSDH
jgi:hypothetical protein